MSHPGNDDSHNTASGDPAPPTYSGAPDNAPTQPAPAQPVFSTPPAPSPSPYSPPPVEPTPTFTPPAADPTPTYPTPSYQQPTYPAPTYQAPPPQSPAQSPVFMAPPVSAPPPPGPQQPPMSGYPQTAGYPPVPAPPTYDPAAMAQQYSAPPTSGPYGYGMPMMSAIPAPPAAPRSRVGVVVLSVLTAVFLVMAGIFGTLFIMKNQEADKLSAQVTQLTTDVSAAKNRSEGLQKDLDSAKRDLSDSKEQVDEVTAQKKAIADCFNAITAFSQEFAKAGGKETAATSALEAELNRKCAEAQKYL